MNNPAPDHPPLDKAPQMGILQRIVDLLAVRRYDRAHARTLRHRERRRPVAI